MLLAAQYKAVAASTIVISGRGRILGYSVRENAETPAAASLDMYDGISTAGQLLIPLVLATSGRDVQWFGPQGIEFSSGFFLGAMTGSMVGTVWFVAETLKGSHMVESTNTIDATLRPRWTTADVERMLNGGF